MPKQPKNPPLKSPAQQHARLMAKFIKKVSDTINMDGLEVVASQHGISASEMMAQSLLTWKKFRIGRYWFRGDCYHTTVNGHGGVKSLEYPITTFIGMSEEVVDKLWASDWSGLKKMKVMK